MPKFEMVPLSEAQARIALTGRRGQIIREYINYIQQIGPDRAGRLRAVEGEKITTIRRRLGQAAETLGTRLVIKRSGEEVYFWVEAAAEQRPSRGRRSRNPSEEPRRLE